MKNTGIGNGVPEYGHAVLRAGGRRARSRCSTRGPRWARGVHTVLRQIACEELGLAARAGARGGRHRARARHRARRPRRASTVLGGNAVHRRRPEARGALDGGRSRRSPGRSSAGEFVVDWTTAERRRRAGHAPRVRLGDAGRDPRRRRPAREGGRRPRRRAGDQPDARRGPDRGRRPHGPRPRALRGVRRRGRRARHRDAEVAAHHPAGRDARRSSASSSRSRSPRGRTARRASARRRSCRRPPRSPGALLRVRRHPADAPADEGLARPRSRPCRSSSAREGADDDPHRRDRRHVARPASQVERCDVARRGTAGSSPSRGGARRDCSGCLVVPGNVCAHTHLYSALARGMPYALAPPRELRPDPPARLVAPRPRARRGARPRVGARRRDGGAALRHDDARRPPRLAERDRRLARRGRDALGALGVRSVLCYETPTATGPSARAPGIEENRRFLERVRREQPPLARALVGAHASFTLSDETLAACADAARTLGAGIHVHAAEDAADERDAVGALRRRASRERLARAGALERAHAARARRPPRRRRRSRSSHAAGATVAHNARSNMNNAVGRAAPGRARHARRARHRRDRRGHVRGVAGGVLPAPRGRRPAPAPTGRSRAWPRARGSPGALFERAAARDGSRPGAPADLVVLDYAGARRLSTRRASPGTGSSGSRRAASAT